MDTLPLSISDEEYERIKAAEAVVITTYSGPDGRFTRLRFIGSREEAEVIASTQQLVIVPTGITCEGCEVVNTSELIPPEIE